MGTLSPPPRVAEIRREEAGAGWPAIPLMAAVAALVLTAARGYLKSQKEPPAPVVQPTAAVVQVQPTAAPAPTPVPTVDLERDLRIAEEFLKEHLKAPSTYKRISSLEVWGVERPPFQNRVRRAEQLRRTHPGVFLCSASGGGPGGTRNDTVRRRGFSRVETIVRSALEMTKA
jgi:hypothetical protein